MNKEQLHKHGYLPISANIFGNDININYVDSLGRSNDGFICGDSAWMSSTINISHNVDGEQMSYDAKLNTAIHEVLHIILGMGAYEDENSNEKLIQHLANGLVTFIKTSVWSNVKDINESVKLEIVENMKQKLGI